MNEYTQNQARLYINRLNQSAQAEPQPEPKRKNTPIIRKLLVLLAGLTGRR